MELKHTAKREGRLSSFLKEELSMSTGLINRLKWQDKLFVNGTPQHTDYPVKPEDVITVDLQEPAPDYPAEDGPLDILYEDDHILAVDKPAGMLIHPSRAQFGGTLANRVLGYYQKKGEQALFHPLTRLDRDTFGIVLVAKNSHIHALLSAGHVQKTYEALVYGQVAEDRVIDAPIARLPLPSLLRQIDPAGKPSVTDLQVIERMEGCTRVALSPLTGRTHQLRLHCAHIGHPILGDPQYNTPQSKAFSDTLGLSYQQLCAKTLAFEHPITGENMLLQSNMKPTVKFQFIGQMPEMQNAECKVQND